MSCHIIRIFSSCLFHSTTHADEMQKMSIFRKCVNPLRFALITSFLLCFILFLFDYSAIINDAKNKAAILLVSDDLANISTSTTTTTPPVSFSPISISTDQNKNPNEGGPSLQGNSSISSQSSKEASSRKINTKTKTKNMKKKKKKKKKKFKKTDPVLYDEFNQSRIRLPKAGTRTGTETETETEAETSSCSGKYIYVHDLPPRFNDNLVHNCKLPHLKWSEVCRFVWENMGLGPKVQMSSSSSKRVLMNNGWYFTNQFSLEVIFHHRMKQYKCLTKNSSLATAIYVPFYAGLDVGPYLWGFNISMRDRNSVDLMKWLSERSEWKRMWGRDHFLVGGRISWDFRRSSNNDNGSDWGSKLMFLPEANNMTMLTIETGYWNNEFAIPYPTYFHPTNDKQILDWQKKMKSQKRIFLFSFVGGPRPNQEDSIRSELINQCKSASRSCNFLACVPGENKCSNPVTVIRNLQNSIFCLQPPGDSLTRRSIFDSLLCGCIPVFFHPGTAYAQYVWHLPPNNSYKNKYSVFISSKKVKAKKVNITEILIGVPSSEVLAMRNQVIRMIPGILYADPSPGSRLRTFEDAFDITVNHILDRVENISKGIREGKDPSLGFADINITKFDIPGIE